MIKTFYFLFNPNGIATRLEFSMFFLAYITMSINIGILNKIHNQLVVCVFLFIYALIAYSLIASCIKRLHDIGISGWWSILPIFPLFLCIFAKGEQRKNKYGLPKKQCLRLTRSLANHST